MPESFDYPRSVHRWAGEEVNKFKDAAKAFVDSCKPKGFKQLDLATGEMIQGCVLEERAPDELLKIAYHIINDLRNALDQAVHAASLTLGTRYPDKTNFPVVEDASGLLRRLQTSPVCKGVPPELYPVIMSFQPYWQEREGDDGDTIIRALMEAANPNKHRIPIRVGLDISTIAIRTMVGVTLQVRKITEHKVEIFRVRPGEVPNVDMDIQATVTFDEGRWLKGKMASVVFKLMHDRAGHIIDRLEAETLRILSARKQGDDVTHG